LNTKRITADDTRAVKKISYINHQRENTAYALKKEQQEPHAQRLIQIGPRLLN
jgi:hypothetical protein